MKKSNKELSIIYSEKNESPIVVDDIEANKVFKQLFNLINLNHPELGEVKELVVSGEYLSACQLYVSVLAKRFSQFPMINQFSYWLYNTSDADELLEGILTFTHYGNPHRQFTTNIGKPGNINFFKKASLDYDLSVRDISSMQWVTQYAETYAKTKDKKYLKGWQETWTDFDTVAFYGIKI